MNSTRRFLSIVVALVILVSVVSSTCAAQRLQRAPVNPEFVAYRDAVFAGTWRNVTSGGHPLGAIPAPVYREPGPRVPAERPWNGFPSSYDLRNVSGKLPAVRDQNPWGSCWAHATYASLESCLRPSDTFDGSENNLMNLHGFDYNCNQGGHPWMSMAYLARWSGAVAEASDPYNNVTCSSVAGCAPAKHVQEVWILPSRTSATDNDTIKGMVTNYGAVYVVYYHDDTYYNATNHAYYYNGSADINHAVAVVGWDDNYPATNFNSTPPGNGAFICRNSWGTGWGENGYFYVSYYDTKIGYSQVSLFPNAEATTNYTGIYSYDPLGEVNDVNCAWAANVFSTGGAAQTIQAVGFYTPVGGANYTVYVYKNPTGGNPRSGTLAATETGTRTYAGYATVPLSTPVSMSTADSSFSVVTYLTNAGTWPSAFEYAIAGYSSGATANAGESYYSFDGTSWADLTTFDSTANFCLKAYAGAPAPPSLEWAGTTGYETDGVDPDIGEPTIAAPTTFTFKVKYTDPTGNAPTVARCVIQKKGASGWSDYARADMTLESGAIATGAIYSCATQLPNEVVKYRFLFLDSGGTPVSGAPATFQQGQPSLTGVPHLCWSGKAGFDTDGVSPDSGPTGTSFLFQVKYMDAAGDAPTQAQVEIRRNGSLWRTLDMNAWAGGDYCLGRIYQRRTTINKTGTYEYRFAFADATGAATGDPTNWQSGPTIGGGAAMLASVSALPTKAGAQVTFALTGAARVSAFVVNVAGRPIRTLVTDKALDEGVQTLVWDRKAASGLTVPPGLYVIRVSAKGPDGGQSTALATVTLK